MEITAALAGFFLGTTLVLLIERRDRKALIRSINVERMLWTNKVLIREGSTSIFPTSMLTEDGEVVEATGPKSVAKRVLSPFWSGRLKKKEELRVASQKEAGTHLPENIKNRIVAKAEEAKAA